MALTTPLDSPSSRVRARARRRPAAATLTVLAAIARVACAIAAFVRGVATRIRDHESTISGGHLLAIYTSYAVVCAIAVYAIRAGR